MFGLTVKIEGSDVILLDHNGHEVIRMVTSEALNLSKGLHNAVLAIDHGSDW